MPTGCDKTGVPADYVKVIESEHTAQGFVTTDLDNNQICGLPPGGDAKVAPE